MKHTMTKFFSMILALAMIPSILCTAASAAIQSSAYLDGYSASVTPIGDGKIVVTVEVIGVGRMTKLGAETIYIYESADGELFHRVATYESEDYPIMMGSGRVYYEDAVTHQGKAGYYYYASVNVYAANANGSDTKNYTTSSKRAT